MANHFNKVAGFKPRRNAFDLSYRKNFTCDMGQLIPVLCEEVVPGDTFHVGNELLIRMQPMNAPVMHEIRATVHYFFVPNRIIYPELPVPPDLPYSTGTLNYWEAFISQGQLGGDQPLALTLPRKTSDLLGGVMQIGTLWDYFGFPVPGPTQALDLAHMAMPLDIPWRAYNMVYNEYYRDENLQDKVSLQNNIVLRRNWRKDYFTSSLPFRQKGQAPALPVNVSINNLVDYLPYLSATNAVTSPNVPKIKINLSNNQLGGDQRSVTGGIVSGTSAIANFLQYPQTPTNSTTDPTRLLYLDPNDVLRAASGHNIPGDTPVIGGLKVTSNADATTFNVSDLRLAFQTQKWLERNARAGTRYTEFLRSHFGVSPTDARLDRPEYIGGTKQPVIISEVLQTAGNTTRENEATPIASMYGHGLSATSGYAGKYNVQEYGTIIGLLSVMPKPTYQQGINRQWLRRLPTDFYFPEFAHLSEQAIYNTEIFTRFGVDGEPGEVGIFGYTGQYDEMRVKHDIVCSEMRKLWYQPGVDTPNLMLSYWNMARYFQEPPNLNSEFITCVPRKDIFQTDELVPGLIVNIQNNIKAIRPMPSVAEPGLVDHF